MTNDEHRYIPFYVNFVPEGPPPRIRLHQYTTGEIAFLQANMRYGVNEPGNNVNTEDGWWGTVLRSHKAWLAFRRQDGQKFKIDITNIYEHTGNGVCIPTPPEMTETYGVVAASIGFDDDAGNVLWTQNFFVEVEPDPFSWPAGATAGTDDTEESIRKWSEIKDIVQSGHAQEHWSIGDEIEVKWTDRAKRKTYTVPLIVVSFQNATKQGASSSSPAMWLQWKYAMQFPFEYDTKEAFYYCEQALDPGTYYITWDDGSTQKTYNFTTTKRIPAGGAISFPNNIKTWAKLSDSAHLESIRAQEGAQGTNLGTVMKTFNSPMNSMGKVKNGSGRWGTSAMRQHLNSVAGVGEWWMPQTNFDMKPKGVRECAGFLGGYEPGFQNAIEPIYVRTQLNTVSESSGLFNYETTYDRVFLAGQSQMNFYGISEGDAFPYWVQRIGASSINDNTPFPDVYAFENHNEVVSSFWLRTPATWDDSLVTLVNYTFNTSYPRGTRIYLGAGYYGDPEDYPVAFTAHRGMPVSVIC